MIYSLNDQSIHYHPKGKKITGSDLVLLHQAIDLTASTTWANKGYSIESLYDEKQFNNFFSETRKLLLRLWQQAGLIFQNDVFLDQYHTLTQNQEQHLSAIALTKLLSVEEFPLGIPQIEKRVSEICGVEVIAKNPFDNNSVFHFRIVRPNSNDNNPLHRDVWLNDYANCINLYIPIAGSSEKSSLAIIPGSHHWAENKIERTEAGAHIGETQFNVPAVSKINGDYEMVRPDPKPNEVLVFSPYLIHGGAVNLNKDQTRISIELRLWKK